MSTLIIPLSSIIEGDRARTTTKYGDIEALAESIERLGTIQPIVLSARWLASYRVERDLDMNDQDSIRMGTLVFDLVAGGRRYKALQHLGITTLYHGSTLIPGKPGFVFADEVAEDIRLDAELEENLQRLDMDWIDNVLLISKVHKVKASKDRTWGMRQTASLIGGGLGASSVSYAIRVAKLIAVQDKDILACPDLSSAIGVMLKKQEEKALALLKPGATQVATRPALPETEQAGASLMSFLDGLNMNTQTVDVPTNEHQIVGTQVGPVTPNSPAVEVPLSMRFKLGDCVLTEAPQIHKFLNESMDHLVTDIPYGIDMGNLSNVNKGDVAAEHEVEANINLMPLFLKEAYRVVKPSGYCIFFYDLDHHEKLQTWAAQVGWTVQRWPLIWSKDSSCSNQCAQYNTTKNFEVAMVLRKSTASVLRTPQSSSVWTGNNLAERKLYNNPFAKPFMLWKWIYDMIAFPTQTVLDPFCGEMSACAAAAQCGLTPYGIEINEKHFTRGIERMKGVYALLHSSNVKFT